MISVNNNSRYRYPVAGGAGMVVLAAVVYLMIINGNQPLNMAQIPTNISTDFKFDVYCPINTP